MFEIILSIFVGIILGIFTGLTPGIHINLLSIILLKLSSLFDFENIIFYVIILAMSITHTFFDSFPSILLGVPDENTFFNVLPGHKMLLEGQGKRAIFITLVGSLSGVFITLPLVISLFFANPFQMNDVLKLIVFSILLLILIFKHKYSSLYIILFGLYGLTYLEFFELNEPFFHMFSGIFAMAPIIISLKSKANLPKQNCLDKTFNKKNLFFIIPVILASISTLVFPGISTSIGLMILFFFIKMNGELYLLLTGAMNTITMFLAFPFFYSFGFKRNGSIIVLTEFIDKLNFSNYLFFILIIILVAFIDYHLAIFLIDKIVKLIQKINYFYLNLFILILIIIISFILDSFYGWICLGIGGILGFLLLKFNVPRFFSMNVIFVPVMIRSIKNLFSK